MKETFICSLEKHHIYYVSNVNCSFYIAVPFKDYVETNITFRLKSNYELYDLNKNPLDKVIEELTNYYNKVDNFNVTLILPIFYDGILTRISSVKDLELYQKVDYYLGMMFNEAYAILTKNNIKVNSSIYVINNDSFKDFISWFVARYNNRVEYKTMLELVKKDEDFENYDMVETPNINFVVGKNEVPDLGKTVEMETETFDSYVRDNAEKEDSEEQKEKKTEKKESNNAGFVSYILLGVITFVVSLALLFALVK